MTADAAARLAVGIGMMLALVGVGGWVLIRWCLRHGAEGDAEAARLNAQPRAACYGQRA